MQSFKSLCVFCGASSGNRPLYSEEARKLGHLLAERRIELVWGAGHVGLMGVVADAVLEKGGAVHGFIPEFLVARELAHNGAQQLVVTRDMHERKAAMAARAEAFIAMPGGFGTLDELFEILTWAQLGLHSKPVGLLNAGGFYDPLLACIDHMHREGFIREMHLDLFTHAATPEALLEKLESMSV